LSETNLHAVAVILDDRGVLIRGDSGSGKTALGLALLTHWRSGGRPAFMVADDQVFVAGRRGRLVVSAPVPIRGLAEARGYGPAALGTEPRMVADLVVHLVKPHEAPRMAGNRRVHIEGCELPCLDLPARDAVGGVLAVAAWFSAPPFGTE